MSRPSTDADYNALQRANDMYIEIYFNGASQAPLIIDRSNYLISLNILEESHADTSSPFGQISSNELVIELLNLDAMFSPVSMSSPYHGKIRKGLQIKVYNKPCFDNSIEPDPMGVFYVTEWNALITDINANITANDKIYTLLSNASLHLDVMSEVAYNNFLSAIFDSIGYEVDIDLTTAQTLDFAYPLDNICTTITECLIGAQAECWCNHTGNIMVRSLIRSRALRATLTDADQIADIQTSQGITSEYDGVKLLCNLTNESEEKTLLTVNGVKTAASIQDTDVFTFSDVPITRITQVSLSGAHVSLKDIVATSQSCQLAINNDSADKVPFDLTIKGHTLDITQATYSDGTNDMLEMNNVYIQDPEYAKAYKEILNNYYTDSLPILIVDIMGNLKLEMGDKIRVISEVYKVDFTGILFRANINYDGALSETIYLINASVLEVL